jgi:hypothetical protein
LVGAGVVTEETGMSPERIDRIWIRALTLASIARRSPPHVFTKMLRAEWEAEQRPATGKM